MFVKQLLQIGSESVGDVITTNLGDGFSGEFDSDAIAGTLSFNLPYIDSLNASRFQNSDALYFKDLKRFAPILLYAGKFESDPGTVTVDDLTCVFTGYIDKIKPAKSKGSYTLNFNCLGTLALSNEANILISAGEKNTQGVEYLSTVFELSGLNNIIPTTDIIDYLSSSSNDLVVKWGGEQNVKKILDGVRDTYGVRVHQRGDGKVMVFDGFSVYDNDMLEWELTMGDTLTSIDYGDVTNNVNRIVVYGSGGNVGVAADPTSVVDAKTYYPDFNDENLYATEEHFRRDIIDILELETIARSILYEKLKNQVITVTTIFDPLMGVNQFVKVNDGELYDGQRFVVQKMSFNISKTAFDVSLTCYRSILAFSPESMVTSRDGFTDLRMLEIDKPVDSDNWAGGFS